MAKNSHQFPIKAPHQPRTIAQHMDLSLKSSKSKPKPHSHGAVIRGDGDQSRDFPCVPCIPTDHRETHAQTAPRRGPMTGLARRHSRPRDASSKIMASDSVRDRSVTRLGVAHHIGSRPTRGYAFTHRRTLLGHLAQNSSKYPELTFGQFS